MSVLRFGAFELHLNAGELRRQVRPALELFERVVQGGFFCFPAMTSDPWLDPLRRKPGFTKLLSQAESEHREAAAAFAKSHGEKLLGVAGLS